MSLALHVLGVCLSKQGKLEDALTVLQEALELRHSLGPNYKDSTARSE